MSNQTDGILDGFRMTELGPLPDEWEVTQLDAVVTDIAAGDWGKTKPEADLHQCCVLRGTDFYSASKGSFTDTPTRYLRASSIQKRQLRKGDVLVELSGGSRDQPTGRITLVNERMRSMSPLPVVFSNFVKRLRLSTDLCPEFFWRYWEYLYQKGVTRIYEKRTTGIRNFKLQDFLVSERMPLPPIAEQQAIARVLSTIQQAIEAQDKVIAATREAKKSLMKHLFTYGPVSVTEAEKVQLKETEIGPVPEHWKLVGLGEIGEIITGTTPSTKMAEYYSGPHMFITPGDIYESKYVVATQKCLSDRGLAVSRPLPRDTVLVVCIGTIGKAAMTLVDNCVTNQQINSIITNQAVDPHCCYYLLTHLAHFLPAMAGGVTIPIINKSNFASFRIPLPTVSEQQEITHMLSSIDTRIEAGEKRKAALQTMFKSMLHNLMTGKVRAKDLEV